MASAVEHRNKDPLLNNMFNNGHKVVAIPSTTQRILNLTTSRSSEAVVGDGGSVQIPTTLKPVDGSRPRSLSAGRPARNSVDLIQDVYDRLGVKRDSTMDTETTCVSNATTNTPTRGRNQSPTPHSPSPPRRTRSLGRLRSRWPPGSEAPSSPTRYHQRSEETSSTSPEEPTVSVAAAKPTSASMFRKDQASPKARSYRHTATSIVRTNASSDFKDEKREPDSARQEINATTTSTPRSVKERLRAYGESPTDSKKTVTSPSPRGRRSASGGKQQHVAEVAAVREAYPPKIDIYAKEKNHQYECHPEIVVAEEKKEEDDDRVLSKKHTKSMSNDTDCSSTSVKSAPTKSNGNVASAFLAAIHTPNNRQTMSRGHPFAPVVEILPNEESQENSNDSISAVSEEAPSPTKSNSATKSKPSWVVERKDRLSAYGGTPTYTTSPNKSSAAFSSEQNAAIEKLVDERVRIRFAELERRMETQLQEFMKSVDNKMAVRLNELERNIERMLK